MTLTAREQAGAVIVELTDQGPGIPPGCEQRIFDKFFRAPGAAGSGAGLGLAVCRAIAAVHGGTLGAENVSGGGARFRLTLPPPEGGSPVLPPESEGEAAVAGVVTTAPVAAASGQARP